MRTFERKKEYEREKNAQYIELKLQINIWNSEKKLKLESRLDQRLNFNLMYQRTWDLAQNFINDVDKYLIHLIRENSREFEMA